MAAWGNFSRNASETAAKAVQQVKVKSEVTRINLLIADEKKKMEDLFCQLGRQYAESHHDDYESDFAEVMELIIAAEKTIEQHQANIHTLKGTVFCTSCNAEIPKGVAFCHNCGAPAPVKQEEQGPVCAGCGAPLAENARFCTSCGTPVVKPQPEEVAPPVANPVCPNCGATLDDDSVFCSECGCKVK